MGFKGYKFKHKLIIFENPEALENSTVYAKTFEMNLYISPGKLSFVRFDQVESVIKETLSKYAEKVIVNVEPFDQLEPTLENMGNFFFNILRKNLAKKHIILERLEIAESPVRTFIANGELGDKRLLIGNKKIKLASLLVKDIISQSTFHMTSNDHENETIPDKNEIIPDENEIIPDEIENVHEEAVDINKSFVYEIRQENETFEKPKCEVEILPALELSGREQRVSFYKFVFSCLILILFGAAFTVYLKNTGSYPSGADIYGHIFKSDFLYHSIKKGDLYPLYTELWYNGMQPFRYWAPLPYYILAALQFVAGGDAITSYLLFVFFSFVVGGVGWLLWGKTYNKLGICTFIALIWFLMPDNMRIFFVEGNLPRMTIAIFLPYLFFFIWRFVEYEKRKTIVPIILIMSLIVLCHVMIAAMIGISTFIFLSIYTVYQKKWREPLIVILGMLLSFAFCGFWLYPALQGGLVGMEASATAEVMKALSTPALTSLNPILRNQGQHELFYFGISILFLSVIGLLFSSRKSKPGFYTAIIVFMGTTTVAVPFLEKLPLNQLLWMTRFTPIVYAIFLLSLIEWRKCKRYVIIMFAIILILDCLPSMNLQRYYSQSSSMLSYTLSDIKDISKQRISLLDLSAYGSYPSYKITSEEPRGNYTFGWAWQGATTAHNIVMVNTALERGYYYYLFDRSLELGDDVVVIKKNIVNKKSNALEYLKEGAQKSGYKFHKETNELYIFRLITAGTFGIKTNYEGLAIGVSANLITLEYPAIEEGLSNNLSDYNYEELKKYSVIYLSGFDYDNKKKAEQLLLRLAKGGTKIIIDMNRIPVDEITSRMTFFDVTAQNISFTNQYPELIYKNKIYEAAPYKNEYSTWNTVYLENADKVIGYSWLKNKRLPFLATSKNDNLIFLGYNMIFHLTETRDKVVMDLMSDTFGLEINQLPKRKIVPIKVEYSENKIIIKSPGGEVNSTLSYQDNFRSEQKIKNQNNLLVLGERKTEIKMVYPNLYQGLIISLIGLIGIIFLVRFVYKRKGC